MKNHSIQTLEDLFRHRRFFDLRDELTKIAEDLPELLFYRGAVANKFNRIPESFELLEKYLKIVKPTGEKIIYCYELLGDNYVKSFQYRHAAESFKLLLDRFGDEFDENKKQDAEYLHNLWRAASDFPPQTISFSADTIIQAKRGKVQHLHIPVEINGQTIDFVFDTGADVSSISVSSTEILGLQIIECDISVGGAACRSNAKLTMAPTINIGNVTLKNVILLVLEDKDFYSEKHDYQINGVFGYLSIAACRQIVINQKDEIFIPANAVHREAEQNLCMDEMKPILNFSIDNQEMTFFLDTGGNKTKFFPKFFESQATAIMKTGKLKIGSLSGVGGSKDYPAYIVDELSLPVPGKILKFKDAMIFTVPTIYQSEYHYGNIGQDFIRQFEKMTLDFAAMSIVFE